MKEKTLLKTALICSLIGIIVLFFVSENISIDDQSREEFIKKTLGIVEDAKEMEDTALETEILNMNAPKNKGGRPKKEVKEEKFEGMEEPVEPVK